MGHPMAGHEPAIGDGLPTGMQRKTGHDCLCFCRPERVVAGVRRHSARKVVMRRSLPGGSRPVVASGTGEVSGEPGSSAVGSEVSRTSYLEVRAPLHLVSIPPTDDFSQPRRQDRRLRTKTRRELLGTACHRGNRIRGPSSPCRGPVCHSCDWSWRSTCHGSPARQAPVQEWL